jgi:hypothetical protein
MVKRCGQLTDAEALSMDFHGCWSGGVTLLRKGGEKRPHHHHHGTHTQKKTVDSSSVCVFNLERLSLCTHTHN